MNELERRSFYSFLGLYIFSSLLFILLTGFWYYTAQKHALENEIHYKLEHLADKKAGELIMRHMHGTPMAPVKVPKGIEMALVDTSSKVVEGKLLLPNLPLKPGYFTKDGYNILISDAPREHMGIAYVIVQTNLLKKALATLKRRVLIGMGIVFLLVITVAWILSKIFLRPVQQRVAQVERFINDITHELNTPISSLSMSTEQALKTGNCTPRMLKNISVSTRQLYDIYRSLTYLNFNNPQPAHEAIDIKSVLEESVEYYRPLAEIKRITLDLKAAPLSCVIPKTELNLLFGNLIGNAIKYSPPNSTVTLRLERQTLTIEDNGIGIDEKHQKAIFKKFTRGTGYSGGFGVGLSIVKSICDEYGIGLKLDSKEGEGTKFTLVFKG